MVVVYVYEEVVSGQIDASGVRVAGMFEVRLDGCNVIERQRFIEGRMRDGW